MFSLSVDLYRSCKLDIPGLKFTIHLLRNHWTKLHQISLRRYLCDPHSILYPISPHYIQHGGHLKRWIYLSISALLSVKMISYLNCSWITMSCWSYHPSIPVICILFCQQIYTDYVYFLESKDHIKIFYPEIWAEMIFVWLTFNILFDTTTLYPPSKMAGMFVESSLNKIEVK